VIKDDILNTNFSNIYIYILDVTEILLRNK
jgi:hypothetical protein